MLGETEGAVDPEQLPEFELECLYDDARLPSELTIFSPEESRLATEWLSADPMAAVPLDRIR